MRPKVGAFDLGFFKNFFMIDENELKKIEKGGVIFCQILLSKHLTGRFG